MSGNITRRGLHSWRLKFEAPDATGQRRTRWETVRGTKKQAQTRLTQLLAARDTGTLAEPSALTVADYLCRWLGEHAQHRVSAKTFERYKEIVDKHLIPAIGSHRLSKLAPLHLQHYYGEALTKGRIRALRSGIQVELPPLAARTVKHHHRVLSEALRQAVRLRLLHHNPCGDVDPPRPQRTEMKIIDAAQSAELIRAAAGRAVYIPVVLALTTGMRRGEILAVRWQDISQDYGTLQVAQTLEETVAFGLVFKEPKSERSRRSIALPGLAAEALRRHRRQQAEDLLKLGIRQTEKTLVCCDHEANPISPRSVTKAFADLSRKLGLGVRFHDLRHSHISHLFAAGVHPKIASERAGHASVSITLDVYSHLIPGMQEDAASRIDAALRTHLERP